MIAGSSRVRTAVAVALVGTLVGACSSSSSSSSSSPSSGRSSGRPATGPPASRAYVGRRGAPRVAIAGDSITELSRVRILATLTDDYRVRIDAFTGRTIAQVTPSVIEQVATRPAVEVLNLGTNDLLPPNPAWRTDLDRMLALAAPVPCVEVFTVYDGHPPGAANLGTEIDARLAQVAATGSVHLIDWNAAVHADPGLVVADHIHPGARGQRWIATSIRDHIRRDC